MKPGVFFFKCKRCGQDCYWIGGPLDIELGCTVCGNIFILIEKKEAGTQEDLNYARP